MIKQNNYLQPKEIIMCYINFGKLKNSPMLSVRISSYGCTREVWRARKMRKSSSRRSREQPLLFECSIHTVKSMGKFFYNRATTRICAKKPFIVIECKILTTHKKKGTKVPIGWSKTRYILYFGLSENN